MADEKPFYSNKGFITRGGNQVVAITFKEHHKIMGIVIDNDGLDGEFCSWDMSTGIRIGAPDQITHHVQDLINDTNR